MMTWRTQWTGLAWDILNEVAIMAGLGRLKEELSNAGDEEIVNDRHSSLSLSFYVIINTFPVLCVKAVGLMCVHGADNDILRTVWRQSPSHLMGSRQIPGVWRIVSYCL